ncbi:snf2/rad54 family member [Holotrichia oblita]|uniref:Snf2/rad54 family member n=1 Tax=Holotrichia oblita TaxID=644536 RepID=A0ACB9TJ13_HOLOL|nr:snf2/rad54 family member [Holotrichia oblita]
MMENEPILPSTVNSINELKDVEGINVWGQDQSILEGQALTEIEIFNNENKEPGELSEEKSQNSIQSISGILDIDKYIRQQEELKKKLDFKRASSVSEKSKNVANKIQANLKRKREKKNKVESPSIKIKKTKIKDENEQFIENRKDESGSEYFPSDLESDDSDYECDRRVNNNIRLKKNNEKVSGTQRINDDGNITFYKERLNAYYDSLMKEDPDNEEIEICSGFKISSNIWDNLYSYQQDGVQWLYGLHVKSSGGLLGDEMGLGKTIQVIAFLYGLRQSRIISKFCRYTGLGPTIIVCPTTVIHQWVQHFHEWAPEFRVAVLHQSGSYTGNKSALIKEIFSDKGIIVTSYQSILKFKNVLLEFDWHYIILDEGHKIRNPEAKVSQAVKQFRTPHRLMLTGSPMQNNLQELWSLFDFICPSLLGTLQIFTEHFSLPIMQGGYLNATPIQEATALLMATSLKNLITPYLLRRSKDEVNKIIRLPQKSEQVLFCSLTDEQYDLYKGFLMSEHVNQLLGKGGRNWFSENHTRANVLVAITTLRKICNHPDLYLELTDEAKAEDATIEKSFGYYKKSGKMVVVSALLKIWKKQKHRVLLFTQTRAMISVLENFLIQEGYKYLKMDGTTTVRSRQGLIKTFNEDETYDVFLLTTRVGGLGVNLTGADRVIIYDPDWNPATDTQARERAWRIGQERQVTIYRLVSAGTIEEKMYQRQVWKQLLSNKILLDPKAQKFFKTSDLHDLFSIQDRESTANPETANIFKNSRISMQERLKEKAAKKKKRKENKRDSGFSFSEDKIEQMKKLAQEISKRIAETKPETPKIVKKSSFDVVLEEEKEARKREREYMKTLTPQELMEYNREKLLTKDDSMINKVDDIETEASFSKALEISQETSGIYHKIKDDRLDVDKAVEKYDCLTKPIKKKDIKSKNRRNKDKNRDKIDDPHLVDGEKVEFLVKKEINSKKGPDKETLSQKQDQYVLEQLFSRKNVHVALEHDVIVDVKKPVENRCKIQYEAQTRSDLAMLALRKSRLNDWRW